MRLPSGSTRWLSGSGCKPAQIALAWVLGLPGVTAPIVGASKPHHLPDAVGALSIQLDADTRAYLEEPYRPKARLRAHLTARSAMEV